MKIVGRQGDVIIAEISENERKSNGKPLERENGRIVLAHGEVTGHAHAIAATGFEAQIFGDETIEFSVPKLLVEAQRLIDDVVVRHEEHAPIALEPGKTYRAWRQCQMDLASGTVQFVKD